MQEPPEHRWPVEQSPLVQQFAFGMQLDVAVQGFCPAGHAHAPDWQVSPAIAAQSALVQQAVLAMQTPLHSLDPLQEQTPAVQVPP